MQKSAKNQCFSNTEINIREGDGTVTVDRIRQRTDLHSNLILNFYFRTNLFLTVNCEHIQFSTNLAVTDVSYAWKINDAEGTDQLRSVLCCRFIFIEHFRFLDVDHTSTDDSEIVANGAFKIS